MLLSHLKPERVFYYFEKLTQIPRESGKEAAVAQYLEDTAKSLGLEVVREACNNIIIKKPAAPGYESIPAVIFQGHTDMVCVKTDGSNHNFDTDPIQLILDGDWISTKDTTLGADNGIAVAMTMALLEDSELKAPELIALFTVAEETGMDGAIALNPELVKGGTLINLDSEEEGVLLASNAGGANLDVILPVKWVSIDLPKAYAITIKGLKGGHSGIEIDKNRANAIKLLGRLLELIDIEKLAILHAEGGEKMNAIAKRASIHLATNVDVKQMHQALEPIESMFKAEFAVSDPDLSIEFSEIATSKLAWSDDTLHGFVTLSRLLPQGVQTMSSSITGLVESSNNIGVLVANHATIRFVNALRSSVASLKEEMVNRIALIASLVDADHKRYADYPEWPYRLNSPIRDLMVKTYADLYGKEMQVHAIHAGLECGLLSEKLGDMDMISLGPNMHDVHTPFERVSISSVANVYQFIEEILKRMI